MGGAATRAWPWADDAVGDPAEARPSRVCFSTHWEAEAVIISTLVSRVLTRGTSTSFCAGPWDPEA